MSRRKNRFAGQDSDEKPPRFSKVALRKGIRLFRFIRPYRWSFIGGMLLLAISSLVFMVFPIASGEIINIATGKGEYGLSLNDIGLGLLAILGVQSVVSFSRVLLFTHLSERSMADIREALYNKIITLPITFFEENRVGELTSRTSGDVQHLQDALSLTSAEFLRQIIVLFTGVAYLLYKTPDLSLLMFATFPVIVLLALVIGRHIRKLSRERQDELARSNVILEETLQSIQVVKTFTNEWFEAARFRTANQRVVRLAIRLGFQRALFVAFIIAVLFGAIFYVLWRGAVMVQEGAMTPGDLVTFIAITAIIGGTMGGLADLYTQLLRAVGASERVMDILDLPSEVAGEVPRREGPEPRGDIRFESVAFSYPSRADLPVLKGIDLQVRPGEKVALVGASGAGKSTIIQLLLRLYPPSAGRILLDDRDIRHMDLAGYRTYFAIVPQEVLLFGGTIRENIRYGRTDASEEEILEAAGRANALEFIHHFPEGLDTVIGERGIRLSGGQRQRVAIARAILRNPAILILDEATSSLDADSERIVQEALDNLLEGRTAIIIAHRLATIRHVDRIYVLDQGRIAESGSHEDLTAQPDGLYSRLARLQFDISE
jgi:ATP-binding cassette, subfamily B, bacterial